MKTGLIGLKRNLITTSIIMIMRVGISMEMKKKRMIVELVIWMILNYPITLTNE